MASDAQIATVIKRAGFKGNRAVTAMAVLLAESGGNGTARNVNKDGSIDRGWWQFNSRWHPEVTDGCAEDLVCSTRAAFRVSGAGLRWSQWAAYNNGSYSRYTSRARAAMGAAPEAAKEDDEHWWEKSGLELLGVDVKVDPFEVFQDIARFFGALLNPHTWLRVAEVLGGLVLIIAGIWVLSKDSLPPGMRRLSA